MLLELFDGTLSLNDALNQDIPILEGLKEARQRLILKKRAVAANNTSGT